MRMDINQMNYFINIVECGCNLSLAAKKIHISQSALSQFITNFEKEEEVELFKRKNGRLDGLTESGEKIYRYAQEITQKSIEMDELVKREASKQKGTIRLGVPSLILRVYLSTYLPNFVLEHPDIRIEVTEGGCNDLRHMLINNDLDYAFLIEPTNLDLKGFEQHVIDINEMTAFMDANHPLAADDLLNWSQLKPYSLATFNDTFTTYFLIKNKLTEAGVPNDVMFTSASWDYLIEATRNNDVVTILPKPVDRFLSSDEFAVKHFHDFVPFNVLLCRTKKKAYSDVEDILLENMLDFFYQPVA